MSDLSNRLQSQLGENYTLENELGGGGMSRVFVALEKSLGRRIVVKVLPPETAATVSIERFRREIQVCAALQHPHIVPLISAGEADGLPYYTMPLVPGESLRAYLSKHSELSVKDAMHMMRDVASALAYAHKEGVVHRDIKPENVMLSGGVAVVTDFGVAKAVDVSATDAGKGEAITSLGVALGTPAYMAPEQATADPHVDHRADIYSFGCLAYELLTGASPFAGRPLQRVLAAQVTEVPAPVQSRRANVPPALASLVMRCLEKHQGDRPQTADELIAALDAIGTPSGGIAPTDERLRAVKNPVPMAAAVALVVIMVSAATIAFAVSRRSGSTYMPGSTTPIAITPEIETEPAISPDGRFVAYVGGPRSARRILVRQIGGTRNIAVGSEGNVNGWPRWSPDGSRLAYYVSGGIHIVEALGGAGRLVANVEEAVGSLRLTGTPSWHPDGRSIIFAQSQGLYSLSLEGGAPQLLLADHYLHSPAYAPDGRRLAYVRGTRSTFHNLSTSAVWIRAADGKLTRITGEVNSNLSPVWTPDGRGVLYISNADGPRDIYHQPLNDDGTPRGSAVRVTTGLNPLSITLTSDGTRMAHDIALIRSNVWSVAIPASGAATMASAVEVTSGNQRIEGISLSRDGRWLVYDSNRGGDFDIYKLPLDGGEPTQLTSDPANDFVPSWAPDGKEVAFHSTRAGGLRQIYVVQADGRNETAVTSDPLHHFMPSWSPDGNRLTYLGVDMQQGERSGVYVVTRRNGTWSAPRRLTPENTAAGFSRWSPDGRLIGFNADSSVWVVPADSGQPRRVIDRKSHGESVIMVAWGSDPSIIYFQTEKEDARAFWSVPVAGGTPRLLLRDDDRHRVTRQEFATDGKRLYFTVSGDESDVVVMELTKR